MPHSIAEVTLHHPREFLLSLVASAIILVLCPRGTQMRIPKANTTRVRVVDISTDVGKPPESQWEISFLFYFIVLLLLLLLV